MRYLPLRRAAYFIVAVIASAIITGCAQSAGPNNTPFVPSAAHRAPRTTVSPVIHSFGSGTDGAYPQSELLYHDGLFYGTTSEGGKNKAGTVFSIDANGKETVLHSFGNGRDGSRPLAGLTDVAGTLYGAATSGGYRECNVTVGPGCGTLFKITTSGSFGVVHKFTGTDGAVPQGALVQVGSSLYGTTFQGGAKNVGTVFSLKP